MLTWVVVGIGVVGITCFLVGLVVLKRPNRPGIAAGLLFGGIGLIVGVISAYPIGVLRGAGTLEAEDVDTQAAEAAWSQASDTPATKAPPKTNAAAANDTTEEASAVDDSSAATEPAAIPAPKPGTYEFTVKGSEAPAGKPLFPQVKALLTTGENGCWSMAWDVSESHDDIYRFCTGAEGVSLAGYRFSTTQRITVDVTNTVDMSCDTPVMLAPSQPVVGAVSEATCSGTDENNFSKVPMSGVVRTEVAGIEAGPGGDNTHVKMEEYYQHPEFEVSYLTDFWVSSTTGMITRIERDLVVAIIPIDISITEKSAFFLDSLEPSQP